MTFTLFFAAVMVIATIITFAVGVYVWRQQTISGARIYTLMMFAVSLWSLLTFFEVLSQDYLTVKTLRSLQHLGKAWIPGLWFLFTLRFTQPDIHLSRKLLITVMALPVISLGIILSDPWHGLLWGGSAFNTEPVPHIELEQGLWFQWVIIPYTYCMMFLGVSALFNALTHNSRRYKRHIVILMVSFLVPFAINIGYILGGLSSYGLDP
ncbi:MAG: histidine kinase N-terminal 7TM domain-containing protein, partial [Deinococcota bacterium]